jgi:hypothetical protein
VFALASPLQVEILNHSDWWQQWLPVLTAFIVAAVAYVGVVKSNRTNRKAIDAADTRSKTELRESRDRDFRLWRRDNLLRLGAEAAGTALHADSELLSISASVEDNDPEDSNLIAEKWQRKLDPVRKWGAQIAVSARTLRMLGAVDSAGYCESLSKAVTNAGRSPDVFMLCNKFQKIVYEARQAGRESATRNAEAQFKHAQESVAELYGAIEVSRQQFESSIERELARTNSPATQTD